MVRPADRHDIPRIREMVRGMFAELDEYAHRGTASLVNHMLEVAIGDGHKIFLAEYNDDVVGFCAWVESPACPGEIVAMGTWVHPDYRLMGLASDMRDAATEYWAEHGASHIAAAVDLGNAAGLDSLQDSGFEVTGYTMERRLSA